MDNTGNKFTYWIDSNTNYLCLFTINPILNIMLGYVGITKEHTLYGKNYYEVTIDFYEEITYSGQIIIHEYRQSDQYWFFGFDYGHGYIPATGNIQLDVENLAKALVNLDSNNFRRINNEKNWHYTQ
jgi:hypothetical protein